MTEMQARRFSVRVDGEKKAVEFTLDEMLTANAEDTEFCSWLVTAPVDGCQMNGGGAAPMFWTRRVA